MLCLTENQIMLYLTTFGYSVLDKVNIKTHIKSCVKCQSIEQKQRLEMGAALARSQKNCNLVQDNLENYIHENLQIVESIRIADHLQECEVCCYYYEKVKNTLSYEEAQAQDISVPDNLESDLKKSITRVQTQMKMSESIDRARTAIHKVISNALVYFKFTLQPVEMAFRGKVLLYVKEIKHKGGDLVLDVESEGKSVKLYSMKNLELGQKTSDYTGFVQFKDLEQGQYKIFVDGFEISKTERVKL